MLTIPTTEQRNAHTPVPWRDIDTMRSELGIVAHHIAQDVARAESLEDFIAARDKARAWFGPYWEMNRANDAAWRDAEQAASIAANCGECGGINGHHGFVHERHPAGGGGWNRPCSRRAEAATP
jgi:hypothetical protein